MEAADSINGLISVALDCKHFIADERRLNNRGCHDGRRASRRSHRLNPVVQPLLACSRSCNVQTTYLSTTLVTI